MRPHVLLSFIVRSVIATQLLIPGVALACDLPRAWRTDCLNMPAPKPSLVNYCGKTELNTFYEHHLKSCERMVSQARQLPELAAQVHPDTSANLAAWMRMTSEALAKSSLIQVQSTYVDGHTKKEVRITGTGLLIGTCRGDTCDNYSPSDLPDLKYYVLTAAHVAQGNSLELRSGPSSLTPVNSWIDAENDVAIFEVDRPGTRPAAVLVKRSSEWFIEGGFIPLYRDKTIISSLTEDEIRITQAESVLTLAYGVRPSFVMLGNWIAPMKRTPRTGDSSRANSFLSRERSRDERELALASTPGMSGSPLFLSFPNLNSPGRNVMIIAGLVTRTGFSSDQGPSSHLVGDKAILRLIRNAEEGARLREKAKWSVFAGHFLKEISSDSPSSQNQVLVFLDQGSIVGNGLIAEGHAPVSPADRGDQASSLDDQLMMMLGSDPTFANRTLVPMR